jgi:signal transduction histidine kinase/CheY-like chemotaxis protein/HPt (histidine-containing phosphotransfer) domain-containing protein
VKKSIEYFKQFILSQNLSRAKTKEFLQHIKVIEEAKFKSHENYNTSLQEKEVSITAFNGTVKELEEKNELVKLQQNQQEDAIFKEKFLANISHELRTPLNAITGMGHLLETTSLDEQQQEFVNVIKTGADNLLILINDLLELSSLRERAIEIQERPFSIDKLLTDLYRMVWFKTNEKQLRLTVKNKEKLPDYLLGDGSRLHQILMKLLSNATKFTSKGEISLEIKVLQQASQSIFLQFIVADTGIGIAPNKIKHIFDSFTKGHESEDEKKIYAGTGTGLSIVKYLAQIMDGNISVQSQLGKGSQFTLIIPFKIPEKEAVNQYLDQQKIVAVGGWQGKKILYIEDNDANIFYLKNMLDGYPIKLDIAEDLSQSQALLTKKTYDCILSDVKLPDGNGIDFISELRKNTKTLNNRTPVIVITAGATDSERYKAQQIGIEGYISKPFTPDTLFGELNRIFQAKSNLASLLNFYKKPVKEKEKTNQTSLPHLNKIMNGNKKAMVEMIDIFLKQLPDTTKKIEDLLQKKDWKKVHFEAHKLKSTIGIIGLEELHKLILNINEYTRELKNLHLVVPLFRDFEKQAAIDIERIKTERKRLTRGSKRTSGR